MKKITFLLLTIFACTNTFYATNIKTTAIVDVSVEAENGTLNRGASIQDCASCSGGKHVGDLGGPAESAPNKYFVSTVTVSTAGTYTMNLFASSGDPRSIFVGINGGNGIEVAVNSGDWTTPAMYELVVTLAEGTNTIKFYNDNSFAPNIDKFDLTLLSAATCTECYGPFEAENGVITAPAQISNCDTCSGGQHVSDMGFSDRYFTYDVSITTPGTYKLYVSYISGDPRDITVTVNGTTDFSTSVNSIDWNVVFVKEIEVMLAAGVNSLKFHNPGNWAPNIDKFSLELVSSSLSLENQNIQNLSVYPNPSKEGWNINSKNTISSIIVYDIAGKKVIDTKLNSNDTFINSSNLNTGIYFSQINTEQGIVNKKLIKN